MPDSIRELLHGIADGEPGPSRDLTAGAYRRARSIGRRRFAAVALSAVASLAMASAATAAIVNGNGDQTPPADDPTVVEVPTDPETTPEDADTTAEQSEGDATCDALNGWTGWGPSDSMGDLDALPDGMVFEVRQDDIEGLATLIRFDGETPTNAIEGEPGPGYALAPDGRRFVSWNGGTCDGTLETVGGEKIDGIEVWAMYCKPSWSPDSNSVVLNRSDPESTAYLLDVATGTVSEVPAEVGCSPRWSPDGQFLVSADGSVAMRPDGTDRVEIEDAESWTGEAGFIGVSSISADLSRACLHFDDSEAGASGHLNAERCDRYVDTETGEELELPVEAERPNVAFLADGSMIVCDDQYGQIVLTLVDADGQTLDTKTLPGQSSGGTLLRGWFVQP